MSVEFNHTTYLKVPDDSAEMIEHEVTLHATADFGTPSFTDGPPEMCDPGTPSYLDVNYVECEHRTLTSEEWEVLKSWSLALQGIEEVHSTKNDIKILWEEAERERSRQEECDAEARAEARHDDDYF
jgi:hypothetical protein